MDFPTVKQAIESYLNSIDRKWWQFRKYRYSNEEKAYEISQIVNGFYLAESNRRDK